MTFGFRLFQATHAVGTGYLPQRWTADGFDFCDHMVDVGTQLRQTPTTDPTGVEVWPIPHPADLGVRDIDSLVARMQSMMARGSLVGRMNEVRREALHRVSFSLTVGRVGAFDRAIGTRDDPLTDRAASREYRAILITAPDDNPGMLAVETIARTSPSRELISMTALGSKYLSLTAGGSWHRLIINQITDGEYLQEILKQKAAEVVLTRSAPDGSGDRHRPRDIRLEATVHAQQMGTLQSWLGLETSKRKAKGLVGMMEIIEEDKTLNDVGFDDGFVKIGTGVTTTKVRLGDAVEKFTYPITNDVRPDEHTWEEAVRSRIRIVRPELSWG